MVIDIIMQMNPHEKFSRDGPILASAGIYLFLFAILVAAGSVIVHFVMKLW